MRQKVPRRAGWTALVTAAAAAVLAGCGGSATPQRNQVLSAPLLVTPAEATTPPTVAMAATPTPEAVSMPVARPVPVAGGAGAMPVLVGMDLQSAQNKIQADTDLWYSRSHDLRGDRFQVIDSNWQVCDQSPAAGARLSSGDVPDLGVVKFGEGCP
jgi:hypothetical protein